MSIFKDSSDEDKPYEKCVRFGASSLTDAELIAVIIKNGCEGLSPIDVGRNVIKESGSDCLAGIIRMNLDDFMRVKGIGKVKAIQLACIAELSKRISIQNAKAKLSLSSPKTIADYYMERLRHETEEQVWVSVFDTKCKLISDKMITLGTINSSMISPREIFRYALEKCGAFIVIVHNHPSGDPTPSDDDITSTKTIKEAGEIVGIRLLDHIIIGDRKYNSLRDLGYIS